MVEPLTASGRKRLYEPLQHFFLLGMTTVWTAFALPASVFWVFRSGFDPISLVFLLMMAGFTWVIRKTIWVLQPVYWCEGNIVAGRRKRTRRIERSEILRVERPWWAFGDGLFVPTVVEFRNGSPLLFFPAKGAEDLLRQGDHAESDRAPTKV